MVGRDSHSTWTSFRGAGHRRLVHACVDRIEVDPDLRRGILYLPADAYGLFVRETSTRATLGSALLTGQP